MAFHTKTSEAYGNIRRKPNQPCNYLNRGHKSKVNIFGQYVLINLTFNLSNHYDQASPRISAAGHDQLNINGHNSCIAVNSFTKSKSKVHVLHDPQACNRIAVCERPSVDPYVRGQ